MSMKKRGFMVAAAAAALLLAGCATQGTTENASTTVAQPVPVAETANACKGMGQCKGMKAKKHKKHRKAKKVKPAETADTAAAQ
jgi:hypothetical protein